MSGASGGDTPDLLTVLAHGAADAVRLGLDSVFASFYDRLFELTSASENAAEQARHLDVLRQVKMQREALIERFCTELECQFQALAASAQVVPLAPPARRADPDLDALAKAIVERQQLRWQAVDRVFERALLDLARRPGDAPISSPLSAAALLQTLQRCFDGLELDPPLWRLLLEAFEERLLRRAQALYQGLIDCAEANGGARQFEALGLELQRQAADYPEFESPIRATRGVARRERDDAEGPGHTQRLIARFRAGGLKLPIDGAAPTPGSEDGPEQAHDAPRAHPRDRAASTRGQRLWPWLAGGMLLASALLYFSGSGAVQDAVAASRQYLDTMVGGLDQSAAGQADALQRSEAGASPPAAAPVTRDLPAATPAAAAVRITAPAPAARTPIADPVRASELSPEQRQQVDELLVRGQLALQQQRLTQPARDSAYENFRAALVLDPSNAAAQQGLERIIARYVTLAHAAFEQDNLDSAAVFLSRARLVDPGSAAVRTLQDEIDRRQRARFAAPPALRTE